MREILQKPRPHRYIYGCDFCKRTNVRKETMLRHEKRCYYNPDRICPWCDGSGKITEWLGEGVVSQDDCPACKIANEVQRCPTT